MSPTDPVYGPRDAKPPWLRLTLVFVAIIAIVGLGGWAFAALALKPYKVTEEPRLAPVTTPTVWPTAAATPSVESSSASQAAVIAVPPAETPKTVAPAPSTAPAPATQFTVVIDAGHQGKGNSSAEPIGPGSSSTKPAVSSGAEGSVTHRPESLVNLEIALKTQKELEAAGIKVIMVRTTQNVDITNSERAKIANDANADLLLRLHCDDVSDSSVNGLLMMVPGKNQWTGPIVAPSAKAGKAIKSAALAATGARDRGTVTTTDMSGFNWSKVPSVIVEMGVMSNAEEDRALSSASYQDKLAKGISGGVVSYLNSTR